MSKSYFNKRKVAKNLFGWSLIAWPLGWFLFSLIFVNFGSIIMAFQKIDALGNRTFFGLNNFKEFFTLAFDSYSTLGASLINSAKVYAINFVICNPLYFIFSFYIFKGFPLAKTFRKFMMIPSIVSGMIMALVFRMFVESGIPALVELLTGTPAGNVPNLFVDTRYVFGTTLFYMIWTSFTVALIIYPNAMNNIDTGVFEAARIDGVTQWQEFWHIVFPLIFPTISTNLVLGVADFFTNAGVGVVFYEFGAPVEVQTLGYFFTASVMNDSSEMGYPLLAAGGIILTIITAPVVLFVKWALGKFGPSED